MIQASHEANAFESAHWRPFSPILGGSTETVIIDHADGVTVTDEDGRSYTDATAGIWYAHVGFGRATIADAMRKQSVKLHAYSTFGDYSNGPIEQLSAELDEIAPVPGSKILFSNGGSDTVETAIKLSRRYWFEHGLPQKQGIVSRRGSYHGMHVTSTGVSGIDSNKAGFGDLGPGSHQIDRDDAEALQRVIDTVGSDQLAAFIVEPIVGAGGVHFPTPGYLQRTAEICAENDILFIADEVTTGFGRAGHWFASTRFGVVPDILLVAKAITSGYFPLGAVIATPRVAAPFSNSRERYLAHGYTFSGHPTGAAAALENLRIIRDESLLLRGQELERLMAKFHSLESCSVVSAVRTGEGFLAGIQLDPQALAADSHLGQKAVRAIRARGVLTRVSAVGSLQISPALVSTPSDLDTILNAFTEALHTLEPGLPTHAVLARNKGR
ncbi:Adenosylmethionine-8-amino-7-oxononanoate aminotransferase [Arthrobacter sp. cf158]|uniref:aminotransferase family protein n=1 Tax=Arthrobacter sp. cf158 TaxID=1761744 RepID=UPI000894AFD1|nr:aminotransferase class III-fold pyridoxal phosphate-dependent enzyme [Arthrobacter sp. cf158]SDW91972.1 Adenosylmethionine-8-amino-7-oxononanoate aminotransferase [Arthrobacter sp. cf158]